MKPAYPKYPISKEPTKRTIIVRCPDVRFSIAFGAFIGQELHLNGGQYYSLKKAGGAVALARPDNLSSEFESLRTDIDMFIKEAGVNTVIIINHQNCKKYDAVLKRKNPENEHEERDDLPKAVDLLHTLFSDDNITICAYYAMFTDETQTEITFETIHEDTPLRKAPEPQ